MASAQGNEMDVYAFRQEVSLAYAFWRVLRAMARSIPSIRLLASAQGNGKKYPEHKPFGECSGQWQELPRSIQSRSLLASAQGNQMEVFAFMQEVSRAYAFWRVLWAPDHIIALQAFVLGN